MSTGARSTAQSVDARDYRLLLGLVGAGALISVVSIILTWRFLYADAAYMLLSLWEVGWLGPPDTSRWFGTFASRWLPALAVELGWRSPRGVAVLYGLNLWLNPLLAVVGVWLASGRSREVTLATVICVLFLFQTTYAFIESEATVVFCLAVVWSMLTLRADFAPWIVLTLVPIMFSHEASILFLGPVLGVLILGRGRYAQYYGPVRFRILTWTVATLVLLQLLWLSPIGGSDAQNQGYFVGGTLSLPASPCHVLAALAFLAAALKSLRPGLRGLAAVFWTSTALLLVFPFVLPEMLWPFYHYRARALHAVVAFLFFLYLHGHFVLGVLPAARVPVRWFAALAVVVFAFQGRMTLEWHRHLALFRAEVFDARGVIPFPLEGPFSEARSLQFSWSWTSPVRSIVFQALELREVRAIMLNRNATGWQPFDPRVPGDLPDLSQFGVVYLPELLTTTGP